MCARLTLNLSVVSMMWHLPDAVLDDAVVVLLFASWQQGGIADEENGSHLVASIMELHITTRSAVLSRWPDNQLARAHLQLLQRRRWSGLLWLCGAHDGNLVECARHCEGAEYAGVPGQLSLAVKTGSLASIASAAGC